jgi:DNA-binding transcriptional regulator PaaX
MTSPKVNFKGWAEAVASLRRDDPPKPGYKRLAEIARETGVTSNTLRNQLARLAKSGHIDVIEANKIKWYKLK